MTPEASEGTAGAAQLLTERLLLRLPEPGDSAKISAAADTNEILSGAKVDVADARAWIARARLTAGARTLAIVDRKRGLYIGAAGMAPMSDQPDRHEIALWIGEPFAGHGYATEAGHALIDYVFDAGFADRLWCVCRVTNSRGRRVIEKCGFQYRENGMARSIALRGAIPVERFILERRTWLGLKSWGALAGRQGHADFAA